MTLREVGARAGLSRSAAYRPFASREHLLSAAVVVHLTELADRLATAGDGLPPVDRPRAVLGAFVDDARAHPQRHRLIFGPTPRGRADPDLARAAGRCVDVLVGAVQDAAASGRVRRRDPRRVAALLLSTAHGVAELTTSGHLHAGKWGVDHEVVLDDLVGSLVATARRGTDGRVRDDPGGGARRAGRGRRGG